jgi:GlcNAc-PI de-N-acetylase
VIALQLPRPQGRALEVLVVGAHADDIEIGCGGTVLHLAAGGFPLRVTWVVLAAAGVREREAVGSAAAFLKDVEQPTVVLKAFRDGFFPWAGAEVKEVFEELKRAVVPDLVIVPRRDDEGQLFQRAPRHAWSGPQPAAGWPAGPRDPGSNGLGPAAERDPVLLRGVADPRPGRVAATLGPTKGLPPQLLQGLGQPRATVSKIACSDVVS